MKVLLFCCKGFETMEFAPFVDVMGDENARVVATAMGYEYP